MVILHTNHGDITLELDAENAPATVANFLQYVRNGHYDNTIFHRVIDGFMIQGGGMESAMKQKPVNQAAHAVNPLGLELFTLVQDDQGHGFISDAVEEATDDNVMRMAEISLFHSERACRKLRKFLKKHASKRAKPEVRKTVRA